MGKDNHKRVAFNNGKYTKDIKDAAAQFKVELLDPFNDGEVRAQGTSGDLNKFWDYLGKNFEWPDLDESLTEKLPKDLAKAYKYSNARPDIQDRRAEYDYEKAEYTEITPEEAMKAKKEGKAGMLRVLIGNQVALYRTDGYCIKNVEVRWGETYTNKNGKKISNTRDMPFSYVMSIADKIYLTNEEDMQIDPEKLERRKYYNRYLRNLGNHNVGKDLDQRRKFAHSYFDDAASARVALADLEKKWADGDISKNEYEKQKERLISNIKWNRKRGHEEIGKSKNSADYYARQAAPEEYLTRRRRAYQQLKRELEDNEWRAKRYSKRVDDLKANGAGAEQYSYYVRQIANYQKQIADAQHSIEYYNKLISDEAQAKDIAEAERDLQKVMQEIEAAKKELDVIFRRNKTEESVKVESLKEDKDQNKIEIPANTPVGVYSNSYGRSPHSKVSISTIDIKLLSDVEFNNGKAKVILPKNIVLSNQLGSNIYTVTLTGDKYFINKPKSVGSKAILDAFKVAINEQDNLDIATYVRQSQRLVFACCIENEPKLIIARCNKGCLDITIEDFEECDLGYSVPHYWIADNSHTNLQITSINDIPAFVEKLQSIGEYREIIHVGGSDF